MAELFNELNCARGCARAAISSSQILERNAKRRKLDQLRLLAPVVRKKPAHWLCGSFTVESPEGRICRSGLASTLEKLDRERFDVRLTLQTNKRARAERETPGRERAASDSYFSTSGPMFRTGGVAVAGATIWIWCCFRKPICRSFTIQTADANCPPIRVARSPSPPVASPVPTGPAPH